jgi:hypothetical protein
MVQIEKFPRRRLRRLPPAHAIHRNEKKDKTRHRWLVFPWLSDTEKSSRFTREPVEPPRFSPNIDDISLPEEHTPTPKEQTGEISPQTDDFPASLVEDGPSARGKRSQTFPAIPTRQVLLQNPTSPK